MHLDEHSEAKVLFSTKSCYERLTNGFYCNVETVVLSSQLLSYCSKLCIAELCYKFLI